jgi:hypothetical protein
VAQVTKRWDIVAARKYSARNGEGKTQWINVGRAVEWDGDGISLELNALPCFPEWDGKLRLFEPRDKQDAPRQQRQAPPAPASIADDDIPF